MDKKLCCIEFFNTILTTEISLEELKEMVYAEGNFITVDNHIISKTCIQHIYEKTESEIQKEREEDEKRRNSTSDIFSSLGKRYV